MSTEYYPCLIRIGGAEAFLIWYTDDRDGVIADDLGSIPAFREEFRIREYADTLGLCLH
jgi:hypothetical protein